MNKKKYIAKADFLPKDYKKTKDEIIKLVNTLKNKTIRVINNYRMDLYWQIGTIIVKKQELSGWGDEVIEYLAFDLQSQFPDFKEDDDKIPLTLYDLLKSENTVKPKLVKEKLNFDTKKLRSEVRKGQREGWLKISGRAKGATYNFIDI